MHQIGDRVRCINCQTGPWYGRVLAVECLVCGEQFVRDKCPKGHKAKSYSLTVAQDRVPGDMRPWCIPENFPTVGKTAWEHLLEDPLV